MGAPTLSIVLETFPQNTDNKIIIIIQEHDKNGKYFRHVVTQQNNKHNINKIRNKSSYLHNNLHFKVEKKPQENRLVNLSLKLKTRF